MEEIVVENGRAAGVVLRGGEFIRAHTAVISNADAWSTYALVKPGQHAALDSERSEFTSSVDQCKSFVHLHVGIDAYGLDFSDVPH